MAVGPITWAKYSSAALREKRAGAMSENEQLCIGTNYIIFTVFLQHLLIKSHSQPPPLHMIDLFVEEYTQVSSTEPWRVDTKDED